MSQLRKIARRAKRNRLRQEVGKATAVIQQRTLEYNQGEMLAAVNLLEDRIKELASEVGLQKDHLDPNDPTLMDLLDRLSPSEQQLLLHIMEKGRSVEG